MMIVNFILAIENSSGEWKNSFESDKKKISPLVEGWREMMILLLVSRRDISA